MNLIFSIFSWLRELGIVLLTIALFQIWFTSRRFARTVTGIDLSTHDFQAFLCHFLVFSTYLISRLKTTFTWMWAIAFSIAAPVFHAFVACSLSIGDRTPLAHSLGIGGTTVDLYFDQGDGSLLSRVGMAALAVGLFASMDGNSPRKYVAGTIMGFIVVFLPIYTCFTVIPGVALLSWLVGTGLGIGVGQLIENATLPQQKN